MDKFTPDQALSIVWNFMLLVVAASVAVLAVINCYKAIKSLREPQANRQTSVDHRFEEIEDDMKEFNRRLKRVEEFRNDTEDAFKVILNSQLAMLSHEINGNSIEKLKKSQEEIQTYLINK